MRNQNFLFNTMLFFLILTLVVEFSFLGLSQSQDLNLPSSITAVHGHLLALGMGLPILFLILNKLFNILSIKNIVTWYYLFLVGVILNLAYQLFDGLVELEKLNENHMIAGILAGLSHTLLFVAMLVLVLKLKKHIISNKL